MLVEHCGTSTAGEYINTISVVDIASGWWEGEAIPKAPFERVIESEHISEESHVSLKRSFVNGLTPEK